MGHIVLLAARHATVRIIPRRVRAALHAVASGARPLSTNNHCARGGGEPPPNPARVSALPSLARLLRASTRMEATLVELIAASASALLLQHAY